MELFYKTIKPSVLVIGIKYIAEVVIDHAFVGLNIVDKITKGIWGYRQLIPQYRFCHMTIEVKRIVISYVFAHRFEQ